MRMHSLRMASCLGACLAMILCGPVSASALPAPSQGSAGLPTDDPSWTYCRAAAQEVSAQSGLPDHLLAAISVTETGLQPAGFTDTTPWPWTVNAAGVSYRFTSKQEAVEGARTLMAQGIRSLDVGCMQVNLKYHPRAFTNLEEAFDPLVNVTYAAQFLNHLKARHGAWASAIRKYHSYEPDNGAAYALKVDRFWAQERNHSARVEKAQKASLDTHLRILAKRRGAAVLASLGRPLAEAPLALRPTRTTLRRQTDAAPGDRLTRIASEAGLAELAPDSPTRLVPAVELERSAHVAQGKARLSAAPLRQVTASLPDNGDRQTASAYPANVDVRAAALLR